MRIDVSHFSLEDLCIPIAKIRAAIEHIHPDNCYPQPSGGLTLGNDICVGVYYTIWDAMDEIEATVCQEHEKWADEYKAQKDALAKIEKQLFAIRSGEVQDAN